YHRLIFSPFVERLAIKLRFELDSSLQIFQLDKDIIDRRETRFQILAEHLVDDRCEVWRFEMYRFWILMQDIRERVGHGLAAERLSATENLVDHHTETPHIGSGIDSFAPRLLWRHVGDSANDHSRLCFRLESGVALRIARTASQLGQSEIEHLHQPISTNHYVFWFDVAVNNAGLMRSVKSGGDLTGNLNTLEKWQWPSLHQFPQCLAGDELG